MILARIQSLALLGIEAVAVEVEVHVANGLPAFHIVGLPEAAVRESRDRVRAAISNSGFEFPNRRLTVNLAPADLPKDSGRFDLPIAIGVLVATGQVPARHLGSRLFVGELSLSGELRSIRGALAMGLALARSNAGRPGAVASKALVVPVANRGEVAVVPGVVLMTAATLREVCDDLRGHDALPVLACTVPDDRWIPDDDASIVRPIDPTGESADARPAAKDEAAPLALDMADVRGHEHIKAGLEVAAAGSHNVLLIGPPGSGKSMLAQRLPGILPPLTAAEALEAGAVRSLAGHFDPARFHERAFRAPHHSASRAALIGGGQSLRPGEISLAHQGVLFLDELPEFGASTLDSLREPIETGRIALSRAARQLELPARFQLVTAMNPCPCGLYGDPRCRCSHEQVARYQHRISGPVLDRIDLQLWVTAVDGHALGATTTVESSRQIARRVLRARRRQLARQGRTNAELDARGVAMHCVLDAESRRLLVQTATRLHWSSRVFHRIQKIARSVADLQGDDAIAPAHVVQAIGYRRALGLIGAVA